MYCFPASSYCPRDLTRRVCHTGEEAINRGLAKRLDALSKERERANRAAAAADELPVLRNDDAAKSERAEWSAPCQLGGRSLTTTSVSWATARARPHVPP